MKFLIDLIEDIREQINNDSFYEIKAGLLKENPNDASELIYGGEAPLLSWKLIEEKKEIVFYVDNDSKMTIEMLLPPLLILDIDKMMYGVKIEVNERYKDMEVVGFGKNEEQKRYILFIKI